LQTTFATSAGRRCRRTRPKGFAPSVSCESRWPRAINELSQIVGSTSRTDYDLGCAFFYEHGKMIDLNTLIDPTLGIGLGCACAIDDNSPLMSLS
jgi:probable HAF family extracellular repeat protein